MQDEKIYIIKENPTFYKVNGAIYNRDETGYLQALNRIKRNKKEDDMLTKLQDLEEIKDRLCKVEQVIENKLNSIELLLLKMQNKEI